MAIVVDASALVAVVFGEPDGIAIASVISANAGDISVSAATIVESHLVVEGRQGPDAGRDLERMLERAGIAVVPVDAAQVALAVAAWRRFGKGRHPASLNYGDCFSYALSKQLGAPLLFKGGDFSQTDVASAL